MTDPIKANRAFILGFKAGRDAVRFEHDHGGRLPAMAVYAAQLTKDLEGAGLTDCSDYAANAFCAGMLEASEAIKASMAG